MRSLLALGGVLTATGAAPAGTVGTVGVVPESRRVPGDQPAYVGALFHKDVHGGHWCTASVVHSPLRNLIVTAAHCLPAGVDGRAVSDTVFVPAYANGQAPHGAWKVDKAYADKRWVTDQTEDADLAFTTVAARDGKRIEDVTGASVPDTSGTTGNKVTVTGYNRAEESALTCTTVTKAFGDSHQFMECPRFDSSTSGSPWITADGRLTGVLGGYHGGGDSPEVSYSIRLDEDAAALYRKATRPASA
ncbi:trypsin-like serine peptidase [Streptomyces sp. NPDC094438]|uniref:trypsin-like serine peptidase n=1 Tax=Streptomyces sp. NPDC094438 TaxID=3366061 RepID=UPI00381D0CFA